jgi:hypothetical protein
MPRECRHINELINRIRGFEVDNAVTASMRSRFWTAFRQRGAPKYLFADNDAEFTGHLVRALFGNVTEPS